jgi:hypothetical protein
MRRSYPVSYIVFQAGPQDLQTGLPDLLFYLRLHLRPHLGYRQRHPHQQLLPSDDLELVIGLPVFRLVFVSQVSTKPVASSQPSKSGATP